MKSSQQYFNISDDSDNERFSNKRNRNGHQQDQKTSKQSRSDKHNYQSFNQFQKLMESPNTYLALSESSDDDKSKRIANRYKKISKQSSSKASKEQYDKPKQLNNHHAHTHHHTHHRDNQELHEHKSHQKKQEYQQHHSHRKSSHESKIEFQKNNIIQVENQVKSEQETIKESSIQYSSNNQIQKSPSDSTSTNIDDVSEQQQKITFTVHLNPFNSVLTPEEMKNLTFEDSRHYKVIGDTRIFYTRSGNLSQKIKEVHNSKEEQERLAFLEEKKKQQELKKAASEQSAEINKDQKMEDEEENFKDLFEYDKNNRYFQQEQKHQMTCRRCKQQGHFERMCMLEAKDVCNNCLGDHYARYCPQKICYSCSQFGHSSANCPKQNSQKCSRCQKPGHIKAECGAIFMNSFSKYKSNGTIFNGIEEEWKKTDDQKIKCLVCHKKGHLNCKNDYQKIRDDIYGNKFQERIQKLRRKEEEAKFQGKIINFHYPEDSESSYNDDNSHLAPPSPALSSEQPYEERKEKKRNSKKKQKRYEEEEDYHHHNNHHSHSHSKHNHSHHSHHSKHSSHRHHHSHHEEHNGNNNHHHHNDSHRHHKSDRYRGRYDDDIQIHVDNDKQYKLKKQIRKESKKYK